MMMSQVMIEGSLLGWSLIVDAQSVCQSVSLCVWCCSSRVLYSCCLTCLFLTNAAANLAWILCFKKVLFSWVAQAIASWQISIWECNEPWASPTTSIKLRTRDNTTQQVKAQTRNNSSDHTTRLHTCHKVRRWRNTSHSRQESKSDLCLKMWTHKVVMKLTNFSSSGFRDSGKERTNINK